MNFILAWLAFLGMALVLGLGILLMVKGNPWLLIASATGYLLAFARFGCSQGAAH